MAAYPSSSTQEGTEGDEEPLPAAAATVGFPRLRGVEWRVDMTVASSSSSARVLRPTILLYQELSDGTQQRLELDSATFANLRSNVAALQKELEAVNSSPALGLLREADASARRHLPAS
eukprot:TRINITY_DN9465_c0_g1_i1.p1 TRINITY_DN9465_c0_g1~~TRINITY_DN9465_c0_g1_i1.p1  ORF type:complete len:119 (+),score=24.12 TRINITY_DN9465_c0_g1_i1:648-1004(+)